MGRALLWVIGSLVALGAVVAAVLEILARRERRLSDDEQMTDRS